MLFEYKDTVTYWGAPVASGYGGTAYAAPIELKARWEDRNDEISTPSGDQIITRSTVFVKQDVEVGGYLYLGSSVDADPLVVAGAQMIRAFIKIPDIRSVEYERRALCT